MSQDNTPESPKQKTSQDSDPPEQASASLWGRLKQSLPTDTLKKRMNASVAQWKDHKTFKKWGDQAKKSAEALKEKAKKTTEGKNFRGLSLSSLTEQASSLRKKAEESAKHLKEKAQQQAENLSTKEKKEHPTPQAKKSWNDRIKDLGRTLHDKAGFKRVPKDEDEENK